MVLVIAYLVNDLRFGRDILYCSVSLSVVDPTHISMLNNNTHQSTCMLSSILTGQVQLCHRIEVCLVGWEFTKQSGTQLHRSNKDSLVKHNLSMCFLGGLAWLVMSTASVY